MALRLKTIKFSSGWRNHYSFYTVNTNRCTASLGTSAQVNAQVLSVKKIDRTLSDASLRVYVVLDCRARLFASTGLPTP
jgi:hypothetical protein